MVSGFQADALRQLGVRASVASALEVYDARVFEAAQPWSEPLDDEPFVDTWRELQAESQGGDAWTVLARHLRPLAFPIRAGISKTAGYRRVVGRGMAAADEPTAEGLRLDKPEAVTLDLYRSLAGTVPVITVPNRCDFVVLVQALAKRNEPVAVTPSQGASMVAGLVNWRRLEQLRDQWRETPEDLRECSTWRQEMERLKGHKELYLDRFMLLSLGPYAAVPGEEIGIDDAEWRRLSWVIRCEHECTHYWTRRVFGTMRNHLLDELLADYNGLTTALGRFRAEIFLRCLGFDAEDRYRPDSRLEIYRGDLPEDADPILHRWIVAAARNAEAFDRQVWPNDPDNQPRPLTDRAIALHCLAGLRLSQLAADDAVEQLVARLESVRQLPARGL